MDERVRFVGRLLDGEGMSEVCRAFGISRKTGYKIWDRYRQEGLDALTDRSRRPVRYANQLPDQIERLIIETKREKPHWGARKIRELLVRRLAGDMRMPAQSTVHAVLDRHGLVSRARKRRAAMKAEGTQLSEAAAPNDLWCTDFKGEFKTGDGRYCYPLTVTDQASRMILACEALESTKEVPVIETFVRLFRQRGLPAAIRSDNGLPFASPNGLYNLSRLSGHYRGLLCLKSIHWIDFCAFGAPAPKSGSGLALPSSGSSQAIRNRTAATSACTEPSSRRPRVRRA